MKISLQNTILFLIAVSLFSQLVRAECPSNYIIDEVNNQCYQFPSQCGSLYYFASPKQSRCLSSCPTGYIAAKDENQQNICKIQNCAFPDVFSFYKGQYCFKSKEEFYCEGGYLVVDKDQNGVCLSESPDGFKVKYENGIVKSISTDSSFSWASKTDFLNCKGIRDIQNLICISDKTYCANSYNEVLKTCVKYCEKTYFPYKDPVTNQNTCTQKVPFDVSTCTGFIKFNNDNSAYCVSSTVQSQYLAVDSSGIKVNLPYCPTGFTEGVDSTSGNKICTAPSGFSWKGNPILACTNQYISYTDLKCLTNPIECIDYLDSQLKICSKQCQPGRSIVTEKSGLKLCTEAIKMNFKTCPFPSIPKMIPPYAQCLKLTERDQCDQFLVKDSIGNEMCLLHCPNGFTDTSTPTQKSCQSPSNFSWHNSQISLGTDASLQNYVTLTLQLINVVKCQNEYNVFEFNSCFKACPPNFTIGEGDPNIKVKYCVGPKHFEQIGNDFTYIGKFTSLFQSYFDTLPQVNSIYACKSFIVQDEKGYMLCWPTCPTGFTKSTDPTNQKIYCKPPSGTLLKDMPIWNCDPTKIKDAENMGCLNSISECKTNFEFKNYACLPKCLWNSEPFYDEDLKINVCKYNKSCASEYAFDSFTKKCVLPEKNCINQYLLKDETSYRRCIPECPSTLIKGTDSTLKLNTCTFPSGQKYETSVLKDCALPKIRDLISEKCLDTIDQCTGYYLRSLNFCLSKCPVGYEPSTNETGNKICKYSVVTCQPPKKYDPQANACYDDSTVIIENPSSTSSTTSGIILKFVSLSIIFIIQILIL